MKLSMMAMATDRLGRRYEAEITWKMVFEVRVGDGGAGRPENGGTIVRIPAIAALGKAGPN